MIVMLDATSDERFEEVHNVDGLSVANGRTSADSDIAEKERRSLDDAVSSYTLTSYLTSPLTSYLTSPLTSLHFLPKIIALFYAMPT
jgi:hypothetical protein